MMSAQEQRINALSDEVKATLIRKNRDYGDSFARQYEKYGLMCGLIRMDDKMSRLQTLISGHDAEVAESIEDTLLDLAGYAILCAVEFRKQAEAANG